MADQDILDLSNQGLHKMTVVAETNPTTVIYDKNEISKIETLEKFPKLQQLSASNNRIVHMTGVGKLYNLTVLNLPNNSIINIEGLRMLTKLTWLNLSGNSIKHIDHLSTNVSLCHLDLSDNSISALSDISFLKSLQTLLLHGNILTNLKTVPTYLPKSIAILSLAENEISDLTEVSYLSCMTKLEQLSIMNNPCVIMSSSALGFDYRPFVINWCMHLRILDGYVVSDKECLKAEWLYCQGKGRHYRPGQHFLLAEYLSRVCPLTAMTQLEKEEDIKLAQVLSKQKQYQRQLTQESSLISPDPPRSQSPTTKHMQKSGHPAYHQDASQLYPIETPASLYSDIQEQSSGAMWANMSPMAASPLSHLNAMQAPQGDYISLDDVTEDEINNPNTSLLKSESQYIPLESNTSPLRPMTAPSGPAGSTSFAEIFAHKNSPPRPKTAASAEGRGDSGPHIRAGGKARGVFSPHYSNKFEEHENKPLKTMNQELNKKRAVPVLGKASPINKGRQPTLTLSPNSRKRTSNKSQQSPSKIPIDSDYTSDNSLRDSKLGLVRQLAAERKKKTALRRHHQSKTSPVKGVIQPKYAAHSPPRATGTSSSPKAIYSPDKYSPKTKPARTSEKKVHVGNKLGSPVTSRDQTDNKGQEKDNSGFPMENKVEMAKRATKIQAVWRGFWARTHNTEVVEARKEIRMRRAEGHVHYLKQELERQKQFIDQEKQLRILQTEAIKFLCKEVDHLKREKSEYTGAYSAGNVKESDLQIKYFNLQSQVNHLQQAMKSASSRIQTSGFHISEESTDSDDDSSVQLHGTFLDNTSQKDKWMPNGENQRQHDPVYYESVPEAGFPTPPAGLQYCIKNNTSLVLRWKPSKVLDLGGKDADKPIIGYRVYVNDLAKGMVSGTKCKALLDGLDLTYEYKIFVRAVTSVGESYNSDIVIISMSSPLSILSSNSTTTDSDRDLDSTKGNTDEIKSEMKGEHNLVKRDGNGEQFSSSVPKVGSTGTPTDVAILPNFHLHQYGCTDPTSMAKNTALQTPLFPPLSSDVQSGCAGSTGSPHSPPRYPNKSSVIERLEQKMLSKQKESHSPVKIHLAAEGSADIADSSLSRTTTNTSTPVISNSNDCGQIQANYMDASNIKVNATYAKIDPDVVPNKDCEQNSNLLEKSSNQDSSTADVMEQHEESDPAQLGGKFFKFPVLGHGVVQESDKHKMTFTETANSDLHAANVSTLKVSKDITDKAATEAQLQANIVPTEDKEGSQTSVDKSKIGSMAASLLVKLQSQLSG